LLEVLIPHLDLGKDILDEIKTGREGKTEAALAR
jgi:hypothetical protein